MNDSSLTRSDSTPSTATSAAVRAQTSSSTSRPGLAPAVDIVEDESGITLYADMPGVTRERLGVRVDGDSLVIEGAAEVQTPDKLEILHSEIRNPYFRRSFMLSRELDSTKIEATVKSGVLRLRIPKAEEARPRRIDIKVA